MRATIVGVVLSVVASAWAYFEYRESKRSRLPAAMLEHQYGLLVPTLIVLAVAGGLLAVGGIISVLF